MINAVADASLEEAIDTIAEIMLGPKFAQNLIDEHDRRRVKLPLRVPEWIYTEDVETPDGYPCCELIAVSTHDEPDSTVANLRSEISAEWTVNGDQEQNMGRELKRLIEATRSTFRNISLVPNVGGSIWTGDVDYGPAITARATDKAPVDARFVKSASIQIFWQAFAR